eukprot:362409-Chlamydomonas_euryale.AAC.3
MQIPQRCAKCGALRMLKDTFVQQYLESVACNNICKSWPRVRVGMPAAKRVVHREATEPPGSHREATGKPQGSRRDGTVRSHLVVRAPWLSLGAR